MSTESARTSCACGSAATTVNITTTLTYQVGGVDHLLQPADGGGGVDPANALCRLQLRRQLLEVCAHSDAGHRRSGVRGHQRGHWTEVPEEVGGGSGRRRRAALRKRVRAASIRVPSVVASTSGGTRRGAPAVTACASGRRGRRGVGHLRQNVRHSRASHGAVDPLLLSVGH